jgi:NhaA family Na+:H+ antiporter
MLKSGVHATVAGVMLAFAIPFWRHSETVDSPSYALENFLHRPVAFVVLPIFALANTGILIGSGWLDDLSGPNAIGIISGLVIGKPLGVVVLSLIAVMLGVCSLPSDLRWRHLIGAGMLGGIGFTMSIFITNLAFADQPDVINASKMAVFAASLLAGVLGFLWLRFCGTGEPATEEQAVPAPG